jgi:hypothetical protein
MRRGLAGGVVLALGVIAATLALAPGTWATSARDTVPAEAVSVTPTAVPALPTDASSVDAPSPLSDPKGLAQLTHGAPWTGPLPAAPPATDPALCGDWSQETAPWPSAFATEYGLLQSCLLVGHTWVVTTDARLLGKHSVVAVDHCRDSRCLNGLVDHGGDHWEVFTAPVTGRIRFDGVGSSNTIFLIVGGVSYGIDIVTGVFDPPR